MSSMPTPMLGMFAPKLEAHGMVGFVRRWPLQTSDDERRESQIVGGERRDGQYAHGRRLVGQGVPGTRLGGQGVHGTRLNCQPTTKDSNTQVSRRTDTEASMLTDIEAVKPMGIQR